MTYGRGVAKTATDWIFRQAAEPVPAACERPVPVAAVLPFTATAVGGLRGLIEREKAEIGVFLCFEEPTKPMQREAAEAGLYKSSDGSSYPRLQILTVQQILDGKQPEYPLHRRDATFKKAPRSRPELPRILRCRCFRRMSEGVFSPSARRMRGLHS